jgi:hypothetical protein
MYSLNNAALRSRRQRSVGRKGLSAVRLGVVEGPPCSTKAQLKNDPKMIRWFSHHRTLFSWSLT